MVLRATINIAALTLALLAGLSSFRNITSRTLGPPSNPQCTNPPKRKEWRTLSSKEQQAYISAVVCLANTPSTVNEAGTIYDDFAWLHMQIGARGWYHRWDLLNWIIDVHSPFRSAILSVASNVSPYIREALKDRMWV
jgi:hypothetical protein